MGREIFMPARGGRADERGQQRARCADEHGHQRPDRPQYEEFRPRIGLVAFRFGRPADIEHKCAEDRLQQGCRQGDHDLPADNRAEKRAQRESRDHAPGDMTAHDDAAADIVAGLYGAVQGDQYGGREDGRHHRQQQHPAAETGDDAECGCEKAENGQPQEHPFGHSRRGN